MTAMEILQRCREADGDRERIRRRMQRCRESAESISSFIGAKGTSSGAERDRLAFFTAELDALERELCKRDKAYHAEVEAAYQLLGMVPEVEREVLHAHYILGQTLAQVAAGLDRAYDYVRRVKREGVRQVKLIDDDAVAALLPGWYRAREG